MYPPKFTAPELAAIARVIYTAPERCDSLATLSFEKAKDVRLNLAEHFADELARTNSLFDRERFIRAATTGVNRRSVQP